VFMSVSISMSMSVSMSISKSKPKSAGNRLFLAAFLYISAGRGAYLPPLTPFTTNSCPGIPPPLIVGAPSNF
jgi:hypothetical protein